jgi:hypothetical protein
MVDAKKKWARHVHMKAGALKGWCVHCPAALRRKALRSVVRKDGYATAVRRLNFLRNVANRQNNKSLHTVASRDILWLERTVGARQATN